MNKKLIVASTVVFFIAAFLIGKMFYQSSQEQEARAFEKKQEQKVFERSHSPKLGPENAKVTLVEFLDPECEACRGFYPYVKAIMSKFKNDVRLVVRYVPFHRNSHHAIAVLEATRLQNKFWESLELMFDTQDQWADHHNPQPQKVFEILPKVGVDIDLLKKDMTNPNIRTTMETDMSDAKKLNIRGTPTFFVNGKRLLEFSPMALQKLVEEELNK